MGPRHLALADAVTAPPRWRERPLVRFITYMTLAMVIVLIVTAFGWSQWLAVALWVALGVTETVQLVYRMHRRAHPKRIGPLAEQIREKS